MEDSGDKRRRAEDFGFDGADAGEGSQMIANAATQQHAQTMPAATSVSASTATSAATPIAASGTAPAAASASAAAVALDPTALQAELVEERKRSIFARMLRSTVTSLVVVVAAAVIIVTMIFPILQISGTSMTDTLYDQDIVVSLRGSGYETGDVIAFYYNNKILVKRVIATSGQWVNIDPQGNVTVDGTRLDEPYVSEKALGDCNIKLPYQVPDGRIFVMGDHRSVSVDSRSKTVGCIADEQIVGKLVFCVWPFERFGLIN